MSLSDKLSPEDRRAYAAAYEPLAKQRDAYVAAGDQINAKKIRQQISALSAYYQKRAKPWIKFWYNEASTFPPEAWDKIKAMDFSGAEARVMAHITSPQIALDMHYAPKTGEFVIQRPRDPGKSWAHHQIAMYREIFKKFFQQPKEQSMIKIFNSSDDPNYHTDNRAGVSLTHLLTKDQMFEIAKMAYKAHGAEMLDAIGMKRSVYDAKRAQMHVKRALDEYPMQTNEFLEHRGYRKIQPYTLEVALRQVAEALRMYPHAFKHLSGEQAFCNQVDGGGIPNVYHSDKDKALSEAERLATRTGADVRTYQLVATTKIEEVPVMTKRVVRRP